MAERFERLFSLPSNLYLNDAPVVVLAGALLKDQQSGAIVAQLKFQNISPKIIKAIEVSLSALDITGKELTGVEGYQYLDMSVKCGDIFGTDKAIIMPNYNSRSFELNSIKVVFSDNSVWEKDNLTFIELETQIKLKDKHEEEIVLQYRKLTTSKAVYVPLETGGLWHCTCGCINQTDKCPRCGCTKSTIFSEYNLPAITATLNAQKEEERLQTAQREKAEKEQKKKSKRIKIIIASVIAIFIVGLIVFNVVADYIIPESKYQEALEYFENGDYKTGREILMNMNHNYKDSKKLILKYSQKGDTVIIGEYAGEDIEWLVLDKQGDKLLLISKEALFKHQYSDTENSGGYSWYGSSLRNYLNGSFYRTAFTADEEAIILTTKVKDTKQPDYGKVYNYDTNDKLFLLSVDEAKTYFSSNNARSCGKTYWLRSVGWQYYCASQVEYDGSIDTEGANVIDEFYYVRPAMWVEAK